MNTPKHTFISSERMLRDCCESIKSNSDWLGFDTEFIGERRYVPLLCLIQVAAENGIFIIDTLAVEDLSPLLDLLSDESILKITHAGENDYQLLYRLYGVLPRNVVDVQMAVGFLGDGYPSSFQKIAAKHANARISKAQTVTDWSKRPIRDKQLRYALDDVIYLKEIWQSIAKELKAQGRLEWVREECRRLEQESSYAQDFLQKLLENKIMHKLGDRERIFFIRMNLWREKEAESQNLSREKVMPSKALPIFLKVMKAGKKSVFSDRRIPNHLVKKHWEKLNELFQAPTTEEEQSWLDRIPQSPKLSAEQSVLMDLLNQIFKFICIKKRVSGSLLMPRADFNRMKYDSDYVPEYLQSGWRAEILGPDIIEWLKNRDRLDLEFGEGGFRLSIK